MVETTEMIFLTNQERVREQHRLKYTGSNSLMRQENRQRVEVESKIKQHKTGSHKTENPNHGIIFVS